jgi:D-3-phosphoglycerate dehydrogenase
MSSEFKVVVTDYIEKDLNWEAGKLEEKGIVFEAHQLKFKPQEQVLEKVKDADVIVVNMVKLPGSLINKLEKCKLIIRHGVGYDNVDVNACSENGIQFAYQPDYCKEDVAEHAIALMFACARKVYWSRKTLDQSSENGEWDFSGLFPIYRMKDKTLGILGVGRIGSRVYHKLKSFGFRIIGCDPYLSEKRKSRMEKIEWVDTETIFRESDLLTIHTPLKDETHHIVNKQSLSLMKPSAYLVNTSRGGMIDDDALYDALKKNKIAGAGIDVYDIEPPKPDFKLFELDNIVLTPHISWASEEAGWEIRESILNDVISAWEGKDARFVVNEIKRG